MPFDGTTFRSTNPTAQLLSSARAVLKHPEFWCKNHDTRVRGGVPQFCSVGILQWMNSPNSGPAQEYLDRIARGFGYDSIIKLNDAPQTTHDFLMTVWDEAIRIAKERVD